MVIVVFRKGTEQIKDILRDDRIVNVSVFKGDYKCDLFNRRMCKVNNHIDYNYQESVIQETQTLSSLWRINYTHTLRAYNAPMNI